MQRIQPKQDTNVTVRELLSGGLEAAGPYQVEAPRLAGALGGAGRDKRKERVVLVRSITCLAPESAKFSILSCRLRLVTYEVSP